jgi:hypothetical protein
MVKSARPDPDPPPNPPQPPPPVQPPPDEIPPAPPSEPGVPIPARLALGEMARGRALAAWRGMPALCA